MLISTNTFIFPLLSIVSRAAAYIEEYRNLRSQEGNARELTLPNWVSKEIKLPSYSKNSSKKSNNGL